jgi:glycosyltransferase involved in cell wall biosynthesis
MQKKKVLLITYGNRNHASSRIRALNHFDRLKDVFETTWIPRILEDKKAGLFNGLFFAFTKRLQAIKLRWTILFGSFDIVFVQVMFLPAWCLRILKSKGALICFDFDDAVYTYSKTDFDAMMQYAGKVIVATPYLQQHIKNYNKDCKVIFSPVDTDAIMPLDNAQPVFTIGWVGSQWTLHYLESLVPVFKTLAGKGVAFKLLVSGAQITIPGVDIECIPWSEKSEIEALGRIDIGIMPLNNDEWSKMKGGYKLYLYLAAGRPAVASPYGINADIIKNGITGYLAESEDEWLAAFEKLQKDVVTRRNMGVLARREAEQKYSYRVCTKQLSDFLNN